MHIHKGAPPSSRRRPCPRSPEYKSHPMNTVMAIIAGITIIVLIINVCMISSSIIITIADEKPSLAARGGISSSISLSISLYIYIYIYI